MPFDGITVSSLVNELTQTILNGKIEKIYQPEKDELTLNIRKDKDNHKLLISASSSFPKIHLSFEKKNNPITAPAFCMLLRKHLTGSRITSIKQPSLERIIEITFDCIDEMGYSTEKSLIIEIMGRHSNIILIDCNDLTIIDSIKRVNRDMSSVRIILPSVKYVYPPAEDKIDPLTLGEEFFCSDIESLKASTKAYKYLVKRYYGISPIVAQEICINTGIEPDADLKELDKNSCLKLFNEFKQITNIVKAMIYKPNIITEGHKNIDFSAINLKIYDGYEKKYIDSISKVIQIYYSEKDKLDRIRQKTSNLHKTIVNRLDRNLRKLNILQNEYNNAKNGNYYKLCGDLIMSNLFTLKKGFNKVLLPNYYSENQESIEINLDANLTPTKNAQKYYKMYNKSKNALNLLTKQIIQAREEIQYLEGIIDSLEKCSHEEEINEIKNELWQQGYIKKLKEKNNKNQKSSKPSKAMHFISSSGFDIYVGKNNTQNDYLTHKFASFNDVWMHVKDIPGSHVIIKTNNQTPDEITLLEAANLAAYYSKGKLSSKTPVDYTLKKNVKKPSGGKPGFVIYDNYKTFYITPDEEKVNNMKK